MWIDILNVLGNTGLLAYPTYGSNNPMGIMQIAIMIIPVKTFASALKDNMKTTGRKPVEALAICVLMVTSVLVAATPVSVRAATTDGTLILAQTGQAPGEGIIPWLSTSYYDTTVYNEIFSGLSMRNDTTFKTMLPALAAGTVQSPGWSVDSTNKIWTVKLRSGVQWHDGQPFTADDVKFTYDAVQNATLGSPVYSFVSGIIGGKNNVVVLNSTAVQFNLLTPYAYFVEVILSGAILPKHILQSIPYNSTSGINWHSSAFNTLQPAGGASGNPLPIGTGPYKCANPCYDTTTSTVHLVRNENYFDFPEKGKAALQSKGQFGIKDYYVRNIVGTDAAITALKNGEVNVLDSQFHMETQPSFLNEWGSSRLAIYDAFGVQEMGVNMNHPILGTGASAPIPGAASARHIRQAISYAVPRDSIITQLLSGYGNPAITTPVVGNYKTGAAVTEGFNTALTPYPYNLTLARQALQAAGYTLPTQPGGCLPSTPATCLSPSLDIVLLVPTSNSARRAWAALIQSQLVSLGINAGKVELPFSPNIFARALTPPTADVGKTYALGGFDILFVGYNLNIDADPWSLYDSSQFAPTGQNYYLWNNATNDSLGQQIKSTVDKTTRLNLVKQWQVLARDALPSIPILYTREIVAFDTSMSNARTVFTAYHAPSWPPIEHLAPAAGQPGGSTFLDTYGLWILAGIVVAAAAVLGALLFRSRRRRVVAPAAPP